MKRFKYFGLFYVTMRHDYDLPPDWEAKTAEEKSRWMTQERCRRQAENQKMHATDQIVDKDKKRLHRKLKAHPATVPVKR